MDSIASYPTLFLTVISTAIVLFCSLILIPVQRHAESHSPIFTKYIFSDWILRSVAITLLTSFLLNLLLVINESYVPRYYNSKYIPVVGAASLLFSFIAILVAVIRISQMFNSNTILVKILKEAKRFILNGKWEKHKKTETERINELERIMQDILCSGEPVEKGYDKLDVPSSLQNKTIYSLDLFKDIAIQSCNSKHITDYLSSLQCIAALSLNFYKARCDYKTTRDDVTLRYIEILDDIHRASLQITDITYERYILETIRAVGYYSLLAKSVGSKEGNHFISGYFMGKLIDIAQNDLIKTRQDGAFEALKNAELLCLHMSKEKHLKTAIGKLEDAVNILALALVKSDMTIALKAVEYIFKVICSVVANSASQVNYDYPNTIIKDTLDKLYKLEPYRYSELMATPAVMWNADLFQDISLNSIIRYALFSPYIDDDMIIYNISLVEHVIKLMMNLIGKYRFTYSEQLYQSSLWLIAALNPDFALKLLVGSSSVRCFSDEEKVKVKKMLKDVVKYFSQSTEYVASKHLLSIIAIMIATDKISDYPNHELTKEFIDIVCNGICSNQENLDTNERYNAIHFATILKNNGFDEVSERLSAIQLDSYSFFELDLFSCIMRPLVTFDASYFARLDNALSSETSSNEQSAGNNETDTNV